MHLDVDVEAIVKVGVPAVGALATIYRVFLHRLVRNAAVARAARNESITMIPSLAMSLERLEKQVLGSLTATIADIRSELKTNGGRSLRDEVRAIAAAGAVNAQRLRTILQSVTEDAVFETNAEGHWVWCNRALLALTNRTVEELAGHGWKTVVGMTDRQAVLQEWAAAVADERECSVRFTLVPLGKQTVPVAMTAWPTRNPDGRGVAGYLGIIESASMADVVRPTITATPS